MPGHYFHEADAAGKQGSAFEHGNHDHEEQQGVEAEDDAEGEETVLEGEELEGQGERGEKEEEEEFFFGQPVNGGRVAGEEVVKNVNQHIVEAICARKGQ